MREILAERRTSPCALACLLGLAICRAAAHEAASPRPGDDVLFTFAIFGDNKGGGEAMDASFANMRRMRPSFFIGMGDHFVSRKALAAFDDSIRGAFGGTDVFYRRFYLTPGDDEAGAYAGRQDLAGAERPFFSHALMFDAETDKPLRGAIVEYDRAWLDYYAQLNLRGVRLHILSLYDQDSVEMQKETLAFADRVSEKIMTRYRGEPWIVMAHDGNWWRRRFPEGHPIYACDLLLGASWHVYKCFGVQGEGSCMAFNTSAVGRGAGSWYAVMVLKDKLVVLNVSDRAFRPKGLPGCHVKPFGEPGFDGDARAWFEKLEAYAGAGAGAGAVPGELGPEPRGPDGARPGGGRGGGGGAR